MVFVEVNKEKALEQQLWQYIWDTCTRLRDRNEKQFKHLLQFTDFNLVLGEEGNGDLSCLIFTLLIGEL